MSWYMDKTVGMFPGTSTATSSNKNHHPNGRRDASWSIHLIRNEFHKYSPWSIHCLRLGMISFRRTSVYRYHGMRVKEDVYGAAVRMKTKKAVITTALNPL